MNNITKQDTSSPISETRIAENRALIGGYAYQTIRKQSKQVFKLRSSVLSDTDLENLHQMRIATRRLRSALLLFSDAVELEGATPTQLSRSVAKLTKALGKVRDIDVMQQWFRQMLEAASDSKNDETEGAIATSDHAFSKKETKVIQSLLKALKKRRKKQFSRMESALKSAAYKKLVKQCKGWVKQPKFSQAARQAAASSAIERIVEPLAQLLHHPGWQIATEPATKTDEGNTSQQQILRQLSLDQLNRQLDQHGQQLHDLRKQIKGVRYQTEFFRSLYGIHYAAQIRELRSLQSVLGQIQDQLVLSEFLDHELGPNWASKLPTLDDAFQSSRLELWKQWQPLQEKYLRLHYRLGALPKTQTDENTTVA